MESVETIVVERYQTNLEYFKNEHPKLLEMLNVLSLAIENGDYVPRYDLEYINDYFDVKELRSGNYLYAANSVEISKDFSTIVNFKKNSYLYEGVPVYKSQNVKDKETDKGKGMEGIYPVMDYYIENTRESDTMTKIEKFMFIGVALGLHLSIIDEKIEASEYLIVEDDLELFRLSLFTTNYKELAKNATLYFAIADDDNLFLQTINPFLANSFFENRYLKYAHFPTHSQAKLKQIQNAILSQSFLTFHYKTELYKHLRPLEFLHDGYNVLNLSSHIPNELFSTKPVMLITAGPSLGKNIEWLQKHHEKFIIVAVSSTLKTLYKYSIVPNIVTHIDGFNTSMKHFSTPSIQEFLKNSMIVLGPFVDSLLKNIFNKENVFYYEDETEYIKGFGSISAPCVGSFSLLLSLILNAKELYLLGLDFALDQQSGSTHSTIHAHNETKDMSQKDALSDTMSLRDNLLPVKGNFEEIVYTNTLFNFSIQSLHRNLLKVKRNDQMVYNLNEGAYLYGTTPLRIDEVNLSNYKKLDKVAVSKELKKILNKNSVNRLSGENLASLKKRLEYAEAIRGKIEDFSNRVSKTSSDMFMADLLGIVSSIVTQRNRETLNIVQVYYSYFNHVLPIVFDLFNTEGLKNKKQHIKRLTAMIEKEMIDIQGIYSKRLSDFLSGKALLSKEKQETFALSLYSDFDSDKIKDLYTKNGIGFLAIEENMSDTNLINYIKELYVKFPQISFNAFYFTQEDKELIERIFADELERVNRVEATDIYELAKSIEIYLYNGKVGLDMSIYMFLLTNSMKVACLDSINIRQTVAEIDSLNNGNALFYNHEKFEITKDDIEKYGESYTQMVYQRVMEKLSGTKNEIDMSSRTFYAIDRIEWILNSDGFKENLIQSFLSKIANGK